MRHTRDIHHPTAFALIEAYAKLIDDGMAVPAITTRVVAEQAGAAVSAVAYHFGSLDSLVATVGMRAYRKLNHERVLFLQSAIKAARPAPPPLRAVIEALLRPPVLWSFTRPAAFGLLAHVGAQLSNGDSSGRFGALQAQIQPHRIVVQHLHRQAPWLSEAEVGWRVNAILGIRTQILCRTERTRMLTGDTIDLRDPEAILAGIIDIAAPMFAPPDSDLGPRYRF